MTLKRILGAMTLLLTPAIAFAHPGHGDNGLLAGISHPIGGLDHLLAMLAVGLWAAQQKGAARWVLPCTFVGTLLIGAVAVSMLVSPLILVAIDKLLLPRWANCNVPQPEEIKVVDEIRAQQHHQPADEEQCQQRILSGCVLHAPDDVGHRAPLPEKQYQREAR